MTTSASAILSRLAVTAGATCAIVGLTTGTAQAATTARLAAGSALASSVSALRPTQDVGCADESQVDADGKMQNACTVIYDHTTPAQRKDARDCVVAGGIGAAGGSPGGPAGAAAGGAAGCAGAVYANHSK
jgi:hypothetical protein